jgi:hypothetical protein
MPNDPLLYEHTGESRGRRPAALTRGLAGSDIGARAMTPPGDLANNAGEIYDQPSTPRRKGPIGSEADDQLLS